MARVVVVGGLCDVQVDSNGNGTQLVSLGYTANAADVTREAFWLNVPGDENGGDDGPPIEIQFLGEIARIRLELTKWDIAVAAQIEARAQSFTSGQPGTAGTLMFADTQYFRLLLRTPTTPLNFPLAIPRGQIEINRGTKFSRLILEFECHKDGSDPGVLYNNSVGNEA